MRPRAWMPLCGILSGLVSGLLGVGGGLVVGPMLLLGGLPLRKATGTALAVIPLVALVAVLADLLTLPGNLRLPLALAVAAGGPCGVLCGRSIDRRLPVPTLRLLFQALLLVAATRSLGLFGSLPSDALPGLAQGLATMEMSLAVLLGVAAGICTVLFGVGGGVVVVPGLLYLVGGMDFRAATAVSLLAMIPTTLYSLRLAARDGRVMRRYLPGLLGGALPAAVVAVWLRNSWINPQWLSILFGLFLLCVAARMWINRDVSGDSDPHSRRRS